MNPKLLVALVLAFGVLAPVAKADVVDNYMANASHQRAAAMFDLSKAQPNMPYSGIPAGVPYHASPLVVSYLAHQWGTQATSARPDDRGGLRTTPISAPEPVSASSTSFEWGDFSVGLVAGFAAVLLALGAALGMRRGHRLGF